MNETTTRIGQIDFVDGLADMLINSPDVIVEGVEVTEYVQYVNDLGREAIVVTLSNGQRFKLTACEVRQ